MRSWSAAGMGKARLRPGLVAAVAAVLVASACGSRGFSNLASGAVCDPNTAAFTLNIDNPFFPLPVGHRIVLEGSEGGRDLLVRMTVLDEVEVVDGVQTRVVEEYEAADGRVVEVSRNYFAQAEDGTVCYFGEEVDIFGSDGEVTSHHGAWRADGEGNRPGIFMPAALRVGQAFQQEGAPGVAEDQAKVIALGERIEVPAGTFANTATLMDRNPLDGSEGIKIYARGIGLIVDETAGMTSFSPGTP
jgi:hypothetical protein